MSFFNSIWSYSQPAKQSASADPETDVEKRQDGNASQETDGRSEQPSYTAAYDYGKKFGGLLYNFASNASHQVMTHADKLVEGTVLQDFSQERDKFEQDQKSMAKNKGESSLPWSGFEEEDEMKRQILALSADERNFLRDPPQGIDFNFDLDQNCHTAMALLEADKNLQNMRYDLVPKKMKEEVFWRNYFYRVTLITQSAHLKSFAAEDTTVAAGDSSLMQSSNQSASSDHASQNASRAKPHRISSTEQEYEAEGGTGGEDFVSDAFNAESEQMELMREEIKSLEQAKDSSETLSSRQSNSNLNLEDAGLDEIERELEDLDGEFEVVPQNDGSNGGSIGDGSGWENEIEQLLESDSQTT